MGNGEEKGESWERDKEGRGGGEGEGEKERGDGEGGGGSGGGVREGSRKKEMATGRCERDDQLCSGVGLCNSTRKAF